MTEGSGNGKASCGFSCLIPHGAGSELPHPTTAERELDSRAHFHGDQGNS